MFAQRLAGNGARQQARSADLRFPLDDGGVETGLGRLDRGFLTGRA
jgi:hypothetical protein